MMRKILFTITYSLLWISLFADNILIVGSNTAGAEEQTTIEISIQNDDPFVAFQLEIPLPDQLEYVEGSIAIDPARANGHTIAASIINGNTLLIVAWSSNNTPMTGNSGTVASFALFTGTVPGNYGLNPQNAVIGNASSQNILTGVQSGMATILCPDIHLSTSSLNFGDVIIGNNSLRSMTIYNYGNLPLNISDITFDDPAFSVTGNTSFTINGGSQQSVTIQFDAVSKGTYDNTMQILSDDPDEEITQIALQAYAYAVNEIHTGNMFGYSGNTSTLSFSINNMESFVGFQFDLALPSPLSFLQGSATLSDRKTDHVVAANMISGNELRVVSYSPSNQSFSGNAGEVLILTFNIQGTGGFYSLNMNEVLIVDVTQGNIMSDYSNGQLEVAAPDIHCNTSLNFGEVAINATDTEHLRIYNYGSDTLKITHVNFSNDAFSLNTPLPLNILVWDYFDLELSLHPEGAGSATSQMQILSNDPDENPKNVSLSANVFIPNYISVTNAFCEISDTVSVFIEADNYEEFVGFQFNLSYPSYMTCLTDSVTLTNRAQDHTVFCSSSGSSQVLVFAFSGQQMPFLGNSGAIAELRFVVNDSQPGTDNLNLSNVIMGDAGSDNILYQAYNGQITTFQNMSLEVSADETEICIGTDVQLGSVAVGGSSLYSYFWTSDPAGFTSTSANPTASPTETTLFTLALTDEQTGNVLQESIEIVVQPLPTANAGDDATVYPGQSYQLSGLASNMTSVLWSTAGDGTFENASALNATYHPGENDENIGSVVLTLLANPVEPCNNTDDDVMTLTIDAFPTINAKIFLEGPFETTGMNTALNQGGYIPLSQPFNVAPWNYNGQEIVAAIPNTDVVDWVLVEVRATDGDASTATSDKIIWREAGFLMKNGRIRSIDGATDPRLDSLPDKNLYLVIQHRNHLAIMTAVPLEISDGNLSYDFTTGANQIYGGINGCKEISAGIFGMVGGDGDANGQVQNQDKNDQWKPQFGLSGYNSADYDMNGEVQNQDKNEVWNLNFGYGSQVGDNSKAGFKSQVPK